MLVNYIISRNYYLFTIALFIDEYNIPSRIRKVYLFVRRSFEEMRRIFSRTTDKQFTPLIKINDQIKLLADVNTLVDVTISQIRAFIKTEIRSKNQEAKDLNNLGYSTREENRSETIDNQTFREIKLVLLQEIDNSKVYNFLPMIYMERNSSDKNCLMVYDIEHQSFGDTTRILPDQKNQQFLFVDKEGFNKYLFT